MSSQIGKGDIDADNVGKGDSLVDASERPLDAAQPPLDTASEPDAPAPPACTTKNLLTNGDFDLGDRDWVQSTPANHRIISASEHSHSATHIGRLGWILLNVTNFSELLEQDSAVPAGATETVLAGQIWVQSEEPAGNTVYDSAAIEIFRSIVASNNWPRTRMSMPLLRGSGRHFPSLQSKTTLDRVSGCA